MSNDYKVIEVLLFLNRIYVGLYEETIIYHGIFECEVFVASIQVPFKLKITRNDVFWSDKAESCLHI